MFRTPFILPLIYPALTWRMPGDRKEIYLTFDDGPVPGPTEFVLRELKAHGAVATFFCIGDNVQKHPEIFKRVLAEGHAVGNHTHNHIKGWNAGKSEYVDNVEKCTNAMIAGGFVRSARPGLFRPPYGRIKRSQIKALANYQIVMWDVLTSDYNRSISAEKCLNGSIGAVRPGSIVVFHDSIKAERNMTYALPRFLDHLSNHGYLFQTL